MLKDAWGTGHGYHMTTKRTRRAHTLLYEQHNHCGASGLFLRGGNLPGTTGTVLFRTTDDPSDEHHLTQQQSGRPDEEQPLQEETAQKKRSFPSSDVCQLFFSLPHGFSWTWASAWLTYMIAMHFLACGYWCSTNM